MERQILGPSLGPARPHILREIGLIFLLLGQEIPAVQLRRNISTVYPHRS